MKNIRLSLIITFIFLFSSTGTIIADSQDNLITSSLIITDNGNLRHYQVNSEGSFEIWNRKIASLGYSNFKITDLDNNGRNELIALNSNEIVHAFDLETGDQLWEYDPPSISAILSSIVTGDLTGNGEDELFIGRHAPSSTPDESNLILNSDGDLLQLLPSPTESNSRYGSDNALIFDIDSDGINELILSYGSVLFNYTTWTGSYLIEIWEWNENSNQMEIETSWSGEDLGGNTRLHIYNTIDQNYIITGGWYNNKIRAWYPNGTLLWSRQLYDVNTTLRLAEPQLNFYQDKNGRDHLFAYSNNYWRNGTLYMFDLDPLNGEEITAPTNLLNTITGSRGILGDRIYQSSLKFRNVSGVVENYHEVTYMKLDVDRVFRELPVATSKMERVLISPVQADYEIHLINFNKPSLVTQGDKGYIWVVNEDGSEKISSDPIVNIGGVLIQNDVPKYDGVKIHDYNSEAKIQPTQIVGLLLLVLTLISGSIFYFVRRQRLVKFNNNFRPNWRVNFYMKLNKIVLRLVREKRIQEDKLVLPTIISSNKKIEKNGIIETKELTYPIVQESFDMANLRPYALNFQSFNLWLKESKQVAKNIKLGDIAILIDMLQIYPQDSLMADLISKYDFASKSTLYSRINYLKKSQLIEEAEIDLKYDDIRSKRICISQAGLELLTSLYLSLEITLQDKGNPE